MRSVITVGLIASVALHSSWADPRESTGEAEEILVMGEKDLRRFELAETVGVVPDSADILKKVVGANVVRNGPLTGMAQYRGMSRYRVSTQINGTTISSGGPIHPYPTPRPHTWNPSKYIAVLRPYGRARRPSVERWQLAPGKETLATTAPSSTAVCAVAPNLYTMPK